MTGICMRCKKIDEIYSLTETNHLITVCYECGMEYHSQHKLFVQMFMKGTNVPFVGESPDSLGSIKEEVVVNDD